MAPAISPTQIELWRSCQRKFAFTYLADLPRLPPTGSQQVGIDLHTKVETYLKTGIFSADSLFCAVLPALPPAGTPSENKVSFNLDGVLFSGKYDWLEFPEVGDLKTTSDLKWAKTPEQLAVHPQGLIYTVGTRATKGRWVYVQTRKPNKVKEVRFEPDFTALDALIQDGKDIAQAWETKPEPNSLPPNTRTCSAYGGCPFMPMCELSAGERLYQIRSPMGDFEDLLQKLGNKSEPEAQAPSPESEINPPTGGELPAVLDPEKAEPPKKKTRAKKAEEPKPEPQGDKPIGVLYVGCMPLSDNEIEFADSIFQAARAEINEKLDVADYRFIDYKGAGVLLAAVEERVKALRPSKLVVEDTGPEARVCLSSLMAMAKQVIRRF